MVYSEEEQGRLFSGRYQRDWLVQGWEKKFIEPRERKAKFLKCYLLTRSWCISLEKCQMALEEYNHYFEVDNEFRKAVHMCQEYLTEMLEVIGEAASGAFGEKKRLAYTHVDIHGLNKMVASRRKHEFYRRRTERDRGKEVGAAGGVSSGEKVGGEALPEVEEE